MSATKRPTAVTGLRRGVGTVPQVRSDESIGRQEDIGSLVPGWHGKNVSDMTEAEMQAMAGATPAGPPPRPEKPVRFTLDLDQAQHTFLKTWAAHRGVGGAQVMRALLQELEDNPDLAVRIRTRAQAAKR